MGSFVELNDTLQITTEQGFPSDLLNLQHSVSLETIKNKIFEFHNKSGARIYHLAPLRCFLVHNLNGKWLYWGKVVILEQTIKTDSQGNTFTSGKFKITHIYDPLYQKQITQNETDPGKSYFD